MGKLPWQNMNVERKQKGDLIGKKKGLTGIDELTKGMPIEFKEFFRYVQDMQFQEAPDYKYLRNLFKETYNKHYNQYFLFCGKKILESPTDL